MQVAKWGNSLAVRLPAELVREMGLKEGDQIELERAERGLTISRRPSADEVLAELRRFRGRLPATRRLTRDEANTRDRSGAQSRDPSSAQSRDPSGAQSRDDMNAR